MKTFTKKKSAVMVALALFGGLSISSLASAADVSTYYFNGMNTTEEEAEMEMEALEKAIRENSYSHYAKNFNPVLMYTYTSGKYLDAATIKAYRYELAEFESGNYCIKKYHPHCRQHNAKQAEYYGFKQQMVETDPVYMVPGSDPLMKANTQIISYSRGNIVANMLQKYMSDGDKAKRINIASAGYHLYGNLFTMQNDMTIDNLTFRKWSHKPNYYSMIYKSSQEKFDNGDDKYTARTWRRAWNELVFHAIPKLEESKRSSAIDGHSLEIAYLSYYGLRYQIGIQAIYNHYLLGGK